MYTDNILREIKELIHDNKRAWNTVYQSKTESFRDDDLSEALDGLDRAMGAFAVIEHRLEGLIDMVEMEELSYKVQNK